MVRRNSHGDTDAGYRYGMKEGFGLCRIGGEMIERGEREGERD